MSSDNVYRYNFAWCTKFYIIIMCATCVTILLDTGYNNYNNRLIKFVPHNNKTIFLVHSVFIFVLT